MELSVAEKIKVFEENVKSIRGSTAMTRNSKCRLEVNMVAQPVGDPRPACCGETGCRAATAELTETPTTSVETKLYVVNDPSGMADISTKIEEALEQNGIARERKREVSGRNAHGALLENLGGDAAYPLTFYIVNTIEASRETVVPGKASHLGPETDARIIGTTEVYDMTAEDEDVLAEGGKQEKDEGVQNDGKSNNNEEVQAELRSINGKLDVLLRFMVGKVDVVRTPFKKTVKELPSRTWDCIDIEEAAASGQVVAGTIYRWIADKGFGFMRCTGGEAFVHVNAVRGGEAGVVGKRAVAKVVADASRGPGKFRATMVQTEADYEEELAVQRAAEAAAEAAGAAEEARRRAETSRDAAEGAVAASMIARLARPPGLPTAPGPKPVTPMPSAAGSGGLFARRSRATPRAVDPRWCNYFSVAEKNEETGKKKEQAPAGSPALEEEVWGLYCRNMTSQDQPGAKEKFEKERNMRFDKSQTEACSLFSTPTPHVCEKALLAWADELKEEAKKEELKKEKTESTPMQINWSASFPGYKKDYDEQETDDDQEGDGKYHGKGNEGVGGEHAGESYEGAGGEHTEEIYEGEGGEHAGETDEDWRGEREDEDWRGEQEAGEDEDRREYDGEGWPDESWGEGWSYG